MADAVKRLVCPRVVIKRADQLLSCLPQCGARFRIASDALIFSMDVHLRRYRRARRC
jgi:hypothetical protein